MSGFPIEEASRELASITRQPESQSFHQAAEQGRFVLPRCRDCGRSHWYPRALCPYCFADAIEWVDASGWGAVYSYTVMRRAQPAYVIAYVKLEEGPVMMSNLVGIVFDAIRIGMPLRVRFQPTKNGVLVPMFGPEF